MTVKVSADIGQLKEAIGHPLFKGIEAGKVSSLLQYFQLIEVPPGGVVLREGELQEPVLYAVTSGALDVSKRVTSQDIDFRTGVEIDQIIIATLAAGDIFGELSFTSSQQKSATVRCISRATMLTIARDKFEELERQHPSIACDLLTNIIAITGGRLRRTSEGEVKALKVHLQQSLLNSRTNLFFSYVIGLLCFYNLAIQVIISLSKDSSQVSLISALIIFVFAFGLFIMARHSNVPLHRYGLTLKNWKPALVNSLMWTVVIIAAMVLVKWLLVTTVPRYQHLPVVDIQLTGQQYLVFNFLLYGLHSPVQEFVARGVLQGSLQHFYSGKYAGVKAIVVSNALFAATHVHLLNGLLGLIVFFPGLFWGWLYTRHENLIGVSVSHLLIGWTALFLLNVESLFI